MIMVNSTPVSLERRHTVAVVVTVAKGYDSPRRLTSGILLGCGAVEARRNGRCGAVAVANAGRCWREQLVDQGWRTILPGTPPAAFAPYASAACASGYTAPTWGRRCPWSTRRASSVS